jgi:tRNA 2-thiouridine synthesizing protein A
MNFDKDIDASGLNCPMPIMKAKKEMATMSAGQVARITATDAGALKDIPAFAAQGGHELVSQESAGGKHVFYLKKK